MLKKTWKMKARTGGIRRKVSKQYMRIINLSDEKGNQHITPSDQVRFSHTGESSVGTESTSQNQMDSTDIKIGYDMEFSCSINYFEANNVNPESRLNNSCQIDDQIALDTDARPDSSEESEDESIVTYYNKFLFRDKIRQWAIDRNINLAALKDLGSIVNEFIPETLPNDPRTLLKTPRQIILKKIEGGEYWHNGITNILAELLGRWTDVPDNISLNFNFDGLPIFKSSKKEFWPILCNIFENPDIKPFVIGIYHGTGKPKNLKTYLQDFVNDITNLLEQGILLQQSSVKKVTVSIRCFICDSPARAFIKGVCNFNGKHGCMKCVTVGEYSHNSHTVVFPDLNCAERTDDGFRRKLYGVHHKTDSPLLNLPVDMLKDFPVGDSLHLIDLGIMKRLLTGWRDGNFGKYVTKWRAADIEKVSNFLNNCNVLPCEIHRAVRGLDCLAFWKATEYRTFFFYLSIIILPDVLPFDAFTHFLKLYCAITICSTEAHQYLLPLAEELLKDFVKHYKDFYGADYVTSNVHNLIHVTGEVKRFGPLHSFSAYPFENKLYFIKRLLRSGNNPLPQVARRICESFKELSNCENQDKENFSYPFVTMRSKQNILHFQQFKVSPKRKDKYVLSNLNDIVEIINIVEQPNKICIIGVKLDYKEEVFIYPIKSSRLDIYKVNIQNVNTTYDIILDPQDIKCKLVCVNHKDNFLYFIPLLHTFK